MGLGCLNKLPQRISFIVLPASWPASKQIFDVITMAFQKISDSTCIDLPICALHPQHPVTILKIESNAAAREFPADSIQ